MGICLGAAIHRLGVGALFKGECREGLVRRSGVKLYLLGMGVGFMWMRGIGLP